MLASPSEPFDSADYLFEIKWDGTRAMAYVEDGEYRIMNRRRLNIAERYPELRELRQLSSGTVIDGEIVVLNSNGRPDFSRLQSREQARSPLKYRALASLSPATYVVFDQLFASGSSLLKKPLVERREILRQTVKRLNSSRIIMSEGVVGSGKKFFREVVEQKLEGVVAKRLNSRYSPGRRTKAWRKIKQLHTILCVVIGYVPRGPKEFESLILAAEEQGQLRCVGKVGSGFSAKTMREIVGRLQATDVPVIRCKYKATWVKPELVCRIRYFERTRQGHLRAPVFDELIMAE
jgi:DNA ligase D-like protein (predicted ligase)